MIKASRTHLADVGESYCEHMRFALIVGALATGAGLACVLHAFVPACCERTCSRTVGLLQQLFADRSRLPSTIAQSSGVLIFFILVLVSLVSAVAVGVCTVSSPIALVLIPQTFALPVIYLLQNRDLEPIAA